jgi:CBS-domain-containing membrane protein
MTGAPTEMPRLATSAPSRQRASAYRAVDVMLREPAVLSSAAALDEVVALFASTHVHMVVLTDTGRLGGKLAGTLLRTDLPPTPRGPGADSSTDWAPNEGKPAVTWARALGRTTHAEFPAAWALSLLNARGQRRSAVIDDDGRLLGMLCVKRHGQGFCSDDDVLARRRDPVHRPGRLTRTSVWTPDPTSRETCG